MNDKKELCAHGYSKKEHGCEGSAEGTKTKRGSGGFSMAPPGVAFPPIRSLTVGGIKMGKSVTLHPPKLALPSGVTKHLYAMTSTQRGMEHSVICVCRAQTKEGMMVGREGMFTSPTLFLWLDDEEVEVFNAATRRAGGN